MTVEKNKESYDRNMKDFEKNPRFLGKKAMQSNHLFSFINHVLWAKKILISEIGPELLKSLKTC